VRSCEKTSSRATRTRSSATRCRCSMDCLSAETYRANTYTLDMDARPISTPWSRRVSREVWAQNEQKLIVGVDFNGKIALVKYGRNFRGLKIKGEDFKTDWRPSSFAAAQEAGAIGVLIFTDPGDDGEITEANGYEAYPAGPARQPSSVQRGSVQFVRMPIGHEQ